MLYIDRVTREPKEVHARAVVLCAQALESARILLNSASEQDPNGLAQLVGRARPLPDGPPLGGGRRLGEFPELAKYDEAERRRARTVPTAST